MAATEADWIQKIVSAGIPALVAGLFGLLPILIQRISERSKAKSKQHKISKLANELEFLKQWVNLYLEGIGKPEEQTEKSSQVLQPDLDRILTEYRSLKEEEDKEAQKVLEASAEVSLARRVLLLYRPISGMAWVVHTIFYILVLFVTALLVTGGIDVTQDVLKPSGFMMLVLGAVIIFGPLLVVLQRVAVRLREKKLSPAPQASG